MKAGISYSAILLMPLQTILSMAVVCWPHHIWKIIKVLLKTCVEWCSDRGVSFILTAAPKWAGLEQELANLFCKRQINLFCFTGHIWVILFTPGIVEISWRALDWWKLPQLSVSPHTSWEQVSFGGEEPELAWGGYPVVEYLWVGIFSHSSDPGWSGLCLPMKIC